MNTAKNKWKKATSLILSMAITVQAGWCLSSGRASGAGDSYGEISTEEGDWGTNVYLSFTGDPYTVTVFHVKDSVTGGALRITCDDPFDDNSAEVTVGGIESLEVGWNCLLYVETDIDTNMTIGGGRAEVIVNSGCSFKVEGLSGAGVIENRGTMEFSDYDSSDYASSDGVIHIANDGTIVADTIDISTLYTIVDGDETPVVSYDTNSVYKANTSFTKGESRRILFLKQCFWLYR